MARAWSRLWERSSAIQVVLAKRLVLEEHVEFAALGLKLKFDGTKCVVYKVNSGSIAERHGLAKGDILDSAGDQPIRDEAWVTKKLFHETRPLRLVFLRNHIIQDKIR